MNLQAEKKIIKKLRKMIPAAVCPDGCSECCSGNTFYRGFHMSKWEEAQLINAHIQPTYPTNLTLDDCQFLKNNKCTIYDMRPIICRMYGVLDLGEDKWCESVPEIKVTWELKKKAIMLYSEVYPEVDLPKSELVEAMRSINTVNHET
jgi:Fe-S-cluster containining protein